MFHFYMKFILDTVSNQNQNPDDLQKIIYINQQMLYRLNNKNKLLSGGKDKKPEKKELLHRKKLDQLHQSTLVIIDSLDKQISKKLDMMQKMYSALQEMIKYIDLLYQKTLDKDLDKLKKQMEDLSKKFENYITNQPI